MLDIFLCHSQADREAAADIAGCLERAAEARVWRKECDAAAGETVADKWDAGLSSAAILLLLSPDAVPHPRTRAAWESVLEHLESGASPPLSSVLLRDCDYARLLERRRFFRWSEGRTPVLRALASWLLTLDRPGEVNLFEPARLPWFRARTAELDLLWNRLVDTSGTVVLAGDAGSGKTSLAQEFARAAAGHFRDILWADCGRSPTFVAGDLESQLGIRPPTTLADALRHRVLLVLDDVAGEPPVMPPAEGLASVLITTRHSWPGSVAISPMESMCPDRRPADPECERLWKAMAVCRRNGFPLELAAAIAGIAHNAARRACERLVVEGFADPLDFAGARFRLGARSQQAALTTPDANALRRAHAAALPGRPGFIAEIENALAWALLNDWDLAKGLAIRSFAFLKKQERLREAARIYELLRDEARSRGDLDLARECSWELSWIQEEPGEIRRSAVDGHQLALDFN